MANFENRHIDIWGDKELILYLDNVSKRTKGELVQSLKEVTDHLQDKVKEKLGSYQRGWPKLKRATVIAKYNRRAQLNGYRRASFTRLIGMFNQGFGDDPLVLSGKLKDSIEKEVYEGDLEGVVFSDNEYSAMHEYGYAPKNVPARSYMRLTLWNEEDYITSVINGRIERLL